MNNQVKQLQSNFEKLKKKMETDKKIVHQHGFDISIPEPEWEKLTAPLESSIKNLADRLEKKLSILDSLLKEFQAFYINIPDTVKVSNLKEILPTREVTVANLKDIPQIDTSRLAEIPKLITEIKKGLTLKLPTEAKDAIAVRLSDGEKFYKALENVIQQISGGGATSYAFETSSKTPGKGLIDSDGHIQVDVLSQPAGGSGNGSILDGIDTSIKASVLDYTNSNPLAVRLTDTSGDYVAAGAGTQYTEGDTDASITGTALMMEGAGNALVAATGEATNGLDVDVTRLPALVASTANIGDVDVLTIAAGDNNIGNVDLASSIPAGTNNIGDVDVLSIAAGDNNIGNVDIASIAAGDNNIGNVDIVSLPGIAGDVAAGAADSSNPVKIGGKFLSTLPTYTDGQRTEFVTDTKGQQRIVLGLLNSTTPMRTLADNADDIAVNATASHLVVQNRNTVFDGTTWDRMRGDSTDGVLVNLGANNDVSLNAGTNAIGKLAANSGVDIGDVDITSIAAGDNNIGNVDIVTLPTTTNKISYGAYTAITVTNLQSIASSATVGWQSGRIDNQTSVKATDYEIFVKLTTANTAPANDKAMYVYISPAMTTDGGTTWLHADQGTTTLPTGTEGASTIASPNNLKLLGVLNYTTQQMVVQGNFLLSNAFGQNMPDGFSIIIINFSGAALSTGCVVAYRAINTTNS